MRSGWALAMAALLLPACGHSNKRPAAVEASPPAAIPPVPSSTANAVESKRATMPEVGLANSEDANAIPCRPDREHLDEHYTPGGLYAPHIRDSAPDFALDISAIAEPEPRAEPRSRLGNRSPYVVLGKHYRVLESAEGYVERGVASWYGRKFHGRTTSSREIYDMCSFSAAHKTLPLPTIALVTNLDNGRSLRVRVNDRGPFHAGRLIDLSYAAAVKLGVDRTGTARVEVRALVSPDTPVQATAEGQPRPSAPAMVDAAAPAWPRALTATIDQGLRRYVQVGSYGERDNAERQAQRLRDAGLEGAGLDRADVGGRAVWRVRVGPLREDREAGRVLQQVQGLGYAGARVFSE